MTTEYAQRRDYVMAIIVDQDRNGGAGINDFAEVGITPSAIRNHLRHLRDDGLIKYATKQRLGPGVRYRVAGR